MKICLELSYSRLHLKDGILSEKGGAPSLAWQAVLEKKEKEKEKKEKILRTAFHHTYC